MSERPFFFFESYPRPPLLGPPERRGCGESSRWQPTPRAAPLARRGRRGGRVRAAFPPRRPSRAPTSWCLWHLCRVAPAFVLPFLSACARALVLSPFRPACFSPRCWPCLTLSLLVGGRRLAIVASTRRLPASPVAAAAGRVAGIGDWRHPAETCGRSARLPPAPPPTLLFTGPTLVHPQCCRVPRPPPIVP